MNTEYTLQRSVSEHDSVEGQRSGDRLLLDKLHEGEARRLRLVSGHPHELHVSDLLEELQQLVCGGRLREETTGFRFLLILSSVNRSVIP